MSLKHHEFLPTTKDDYFFDARFADGVPHHPGRFVKGVAIVDIRTKPGQVG